MLFEANSSHTKSHRSKGDSVPLCIKKDSPTTKVNPLKVLIVIGKDEGLKKLFSGIVPRVLWISIGGAIFLGVYDASKTLLSRTVDR